MKAIIISFFSKVRSILFVLVTMICFFSFGMSKDVGNEKIEKLLLIHRKYAFIDLYEKSLDKVRQENNLVIDDSLVDLSRAELYHEYCLIMDFYSEVNNTYENKNYENMINKWVEKTYTPYSSIDDPKLIGHMTFKRAFDFYYSEDLNSYIDSLRVLFHTKYKEGKIRSLDCLEVQERNNSVNVLREINKD